ncbi:endonuclease/exonuclease/phosphatase family protein [Rugosimonospora acidiphila]|uniref:Endonuclease/exonuclease/phosphatase family protein n=1 Tax=Rugosimonospora acidiphila TaxID=556531 RepID=A0ABP9RRK8_9ACTN
MPQLRVASYNVHSLRDDRQALAEVVRAIDPDVVIVQEAPRGLRWRTRCAALARQFGLVYAAGGLPSLGNLILVSYRVRVYGTGALRYPLTPGRHMRGAAFARCVVDHAPFTVVGTHLATDSAERPGQARELKKALADLDAPVVLGADFNEEPDGPSRRLVAEGLTEAAGADPAGTYPVHAPRRRIDGLLVGPGIEVRGYRVADASPAHRASDHFPIVAELTLPARSQG